MSLRECVKHAILAAFSPMDQSMLSCWTHMLDVRREAAIERISVESMLAYFGLEAY